MSIRNEKANEEEGTSSPSVSQLFPNNARHDPTSDGEKHEQLDTLSDSGSDGSSSSDLQPPRSNILSRFGSGISTSRSVSEVRDGISYQRDLETNAEPPEKETTGNADPNLVEWDGPDDPQNPKKWELRRKWAAVITCESPQSSPACALSLSLSLSLSTYCQLF